MFSDGSLLEEGVWKLKTEKGTLIEAIIEDGFYNVFENNTLDDVQKVISEIWGALEVTEVVIDPLSRGVKQEYQVLKLDSRRWLATKWNDFQSEIKSEYVLPWSQGKYFGIPSTIYLCIMEVGRFYLMSYRGFGLCKV